MQKASKEEVCDATQKSDNEAKKQDDLDDLSGNIIKSPLVGTFYAAPSEGAQATL